MAKKVIKKKIKKISGGDKNEKELDLKAIEILKKNLLAKSDKTNKKEKDKKVETIKKKKKVENKKEKEIKIKRIKKLSKKKEQKKSEEKEKKKEEKNNNIKQINEKMPANGGDFSLKIEKSKNKSFFDNKKKENNQTIFDLLNNKQNLEEVKLVGGMSSTNIKSKNNQRKKNIIKKEIENKISTKNQKDEKDKNEYIKMVKSKIVMVNGKMTIEKPDVGLITKKYNEETNKYLTPRETIFVSKDEEVVNSLSFIKMEHTKKWTEEETKLFYKALELFGLDFSFLTIVLGPRKREEIKRKYLKEKKENPKEIERVIYSRKSISNLNQILNLYKKQNYQKNIQSNLALSREESLKSKKNGGLKEEIVDFNKEYKNILNK